MKHFLLYFFALLQINLLSQTTNGTTPAADDVIKLDPRASQFDFVPGQILIKLKDDVSVSLAKVNGVTVMGVASIDAVLQKYKMQKAEKLFSKEKRSFSKRMLKTSNGKEFEQPNLHNIYKVVGDSSLNIFEVINELKEDPNVEYAEPNYILSIVESKPVSPALNESEMIEWIKEHPEINLENHSALSTANDQLQKPNVVTPNDPLYPQQWGIPATQVDAVWDSTTGDTTQLIAILDTGVDWLHPDLKNKIWTNPNEIPDNGTDDDGNGYVDDVRGWDWINNDNNPTDDNSHGTHVAGIAAAEANNGIGIAGVNWNAKILPLKVFQSSGRGDAATITKAIIYAAQKGATVINMSFGSYARSLTMENALANAYSSCILVAAAGNDNKYIGPKLDCSRQPGIPFFPAALSYVLGIKADGGCGFGFSNYDDNPIFSEYSELYNYELNAPGKNIISTIPNGGYRIYQGTSMAVPLISGSVTLYKSKKPLDSQELIWGNLINTSNKYTQTYSAINVKPHPILSFVTHSIINSSSNNNNSTVYAGDTLKLWFTVRNNWGQSDSVFIGIRFGEFEDTSVAQIIKKETFVGSISPYAIKSNTESSPLLIQINPNVSNNRDIVFESFCSYSGSLDTTKQRIVINVSNGTELSGILTDTTILTPNKLWIINGSLRLSTGAVLKILPGTHVILNSTFDNRGYVEAIGTKDSMIILENGLSGNLNKYVKFYLNNSGIGGDRYENCEMYGGSRITAPIIKNCIIDGFPFGGGNTGIGWWKGAGIFVNVDTLADCQIINCIAENGYGDINVFLRNNFINFKTCYEIFPTNSRYNNFIKISNIYEYLYPGWPPDMIGTFYLFDVSSDNSNIIVKNNFFFDDNNRKYSVCKTQGSADVVYFPDQYWGTNDPKKIQKKIYDFNNNAVLPFLNFEPRLTAPSDSAHGIAWKILVNGKDAQDEYVDPVGVGTHRFDVYFNRPMDTAYVPQLTFGVREPYTQQSVIDSSKWSVDRKIWTAYKTIKLYTGDGINRLRVEGARDLEDFEIPVEDQRFEFLISAAGSSSMDFAATAGLGKVNLEWSNPQDVPDLLGYNMYRLEHINDSTLTQPVMINTSLINDTLFTDFNVIPNKKYYYYYRTVRTDFSESDSSRVVSTTPYTAALGDGNGDLSVNVLDVLGTVSYILGQNPQPFIFDAADVVRDSIINVLDVVGNVNIILKGTLLKNYLAKTSYGNAKVEFTGNEVYLTSDQPVAGIQLQFKGKGLKDKKFFYSGSAAFENMSSSIGDTMQIAIMYSLNKNIFAPGKYLIGSIDGDAKGISLSDAVLSDNEGGKINLNLIDNGVSTIPDNYYLDQNYPNPFNLSTTIQYGIPAKTVGKIVIYNILGQQVRTFDLGEREAGRYKIMWDGKNNYGCGISTGVYIFRFESANFTSAKKMILLK